MARSGPKPDYLTLVKAGEAAADLADDRCGSETAAGKPCRRPAGWGTDHPGQGACRDHPEGVRVVGCPVDIGEEEQAVWLRLAPEMRRLGLLKEPFWPVMVALCEAIVLQGMARRAITEIEVEASRGGTKKHPAFTVWQQAVSQVRMLSAELGLTPSALAKLGAESQPKESTLGKLIRGD